MDQDPYVSSLRRLCERTRGGIAMVAATIEANPQTIDQILKGVKLPSGNPRSIGPSLRKRLSAAYPDWLDRTLIAEPGNLDISGNPAAMSVAGLSNAGGSNTSQAGLQIPVLANSASMGPGADGIAEDVIQGTLTVSPEWVAQNVRSTRSDALRFIHSHGDSMAPTFNSGDVLLVDTGVRDVKIDGVYVLQAHDRLFIKRVRQRLDGSHEISSDNPTHKTVDTLNGDHSVAILGRVVWAWNGKRM